MKTITSILALRAPGGGGGGGDDGDGEHKYPKDPAAFLQAALDWEHHRIGSAKLFRIMAEQQMLWPDQKPRMKCTPYDGGNDAVSVDVGPYIVNITIQDDIPDEPLGHISFEPKFYNPWSKGVNP